MLVSVPAAAQELPDLPAPALDLRTAFAVPPGLMPQILPQVLPPTVKRNQQGPKRPAGLLPLYVTYVGLQGLDIHSSKRGMDSGATRESNPLMRPFVNNDAAFIAVKASATAGTILITEKLRKKHPKMAVILAAGFNVGMAIVVANNYRLAR